MPPNSYSIHWTAAGMGVSVKLLAWLGLKGLVEISRINSLHRHSADWTRVISCLDVDVALLADTVMSTRLKATKSFSGKAHLALTNFRYKSNAGCCITSCSSWLKF